MTYVGTALLEHTRFFVDSVCNHQDKDGATNSEVKIREARALPFYSDDVIGRQSLRGIVQWSHSIVFPLIHLPEKEICCQ